MIMERIKKCILYLNKRVSNPNALLFVYILGKLFNIDNYLYISKIEFSEYPKDIVYSYIIMGDKYISGSDVYTKVEIYKRHKLSDENFKDYCFVSNNKILKQIIKNNIPKANLSNIIETLMLIKSHNFKFE